ncbi:hypothetical protein Micbo1qcDRAFT_171063 [Microdochium bolleyi]|uniref:Uncharacterized protein n=1 Tax=Microdochium bolleyi TaxID=196109 RepID=A0A136JJR4_9PEZI|nr:hypothetical protein Micbo1qcDRAFT_171063 [Microdochium bolleyi]
MVHKLQIYVVARVGSYYRSLATVLLNWLRGGSADPAASRGLTSFGVVETSLRLLEIFSALGNRECLRQELRLAGVDVAPAWGRPRRLRAETLPSSSSSSPSPQKQKRTEHTDRYRPFFPGGAADDDVSPPTRPDDLYEQFRRPCPFPFITTCLLVGASVDPHKGTIKRALEQPYGIAFNQTRNEGALVVLDITDLDQCRYGFVFVPWWRAEEDGHHDNDREVDDLPGLHHTPLSGRQYLEAYHPAAGVSVGGRWQQPGQQSQQRRGRCAEMAAEMATKAAAAESGMLAILDQFGVLRDDCLRKLWPFHEYWQPPRQDTPQEQSPVRSAQGAELQHALKDTPNMSSLKATAFGTVVDFMLAEAPRNSPPDMTLLDDIAKMPDFQACLRACLENRAAAVAGNPSRGVELLQLAFAGQEHLDLAPYHGLAIGQITKILSNAKIRDSIDVLSLAAGTLRTAAEFGQLAGALPPRGISGFFLMELPARDGDTFDPAAAYRILRHAVREKLVLGPVLSHGVRRIPWLDDDVAENTAPAAPQEPAMRDGGGGALGSVTQLLFQHPPTHDDPLRLATVETVFLGDAMLQPARLVFGLLNMLRCRILHGSAVDTLPNAAFCFASAPGSSSHGYTSRRATDINPLPAEMYAIGRSPSRHRGVGDFPLDARLRDLAPGQWTVVVAQHQAPPAHAASGGSADDMARALSTLVEHGTLWTPWTRTFRVALVRLKPGADSVRACTASSWTLATAALEVISLEEYVGRYTSPDLAAEFDAAVQDLQRFRDRRRPERPTAAPAAAGPGAATNLLLENSGRIRPILSSMTADEAAEILREALRRVDLVEAELAPHLPRCGHRACTCEGLSLEL